MTVSSTTNLKTFTGDGVTTSFGTSPVVFFDTSDLVVSVVTIATGAKTTLTENTHYTVSGGSGAVGTVSLAGGTSPYGAPASTQKLVIERVLPYTQTVDLVDNEINSAQVMETSLDKIVMRQQQLAEEIGRALKITAGESEQDEIAIAGNAGKYMRLNAAGTAFELVTGDPNTSTFTQSGTGATERTVTAKLAEIEVSPEDFGCEGDGVTDDSANMLKALNQAIAVGGKLKLKGKTYKLNTALTKTALTSGQVCIEGEGDSSVLDFTGTVTGDNAIEIGGTLTQIADLSASPAEGANSLTFASAPTLDETDVICIYNPTASSFSAFRTNYYAGEWCEVRSASGTAVKITNPLYAGYTYTAVDVYKMTSPKVILRNFKIIGTTVSQLIKISACKAPLVENVTGYNEKYAVLEFDRCYKPTYDKPQVHNKGDASDDYGVVFSNSQHGRIFGGSLYARRHAVAHGGGDAVCAVPCRDCRTIGSVLKTDADAGVTATDFHGNVEDCSYDDCTIYGGLSWGGKNNGYTNCQVTGASNGWVILASEIVGGRHYFRGGRLTSFNTPNAVTRGFIDIGGNSSPVTDDTTSDTTFIVENCEVDLPASTSSDIFVWFKNNGAIVATNFVIRDVRPVRCPSLFAILRTEEVTGTADSDFIIVDDLGRFPAGCYLHAAISGTYANFPHRLQKQTGKVAVTATSGTASTVSDWQTFRYYYPRLPVPTLIVGDDTAFAINGNRAVYANVYDLDVNQIRPWVGSGDNSNWSSTASTTINWSVEISDV